MNPNQSTIQDEINDLESRVKLLEAGKDLKNDVNSNILNVLQTNLFDYFWKTFFHFQTFFESIDGFNLATGTSSIAGTGVTITSGAVSGNTAELTKSSSPVNGTIFFPNGATFQEKSSIRTVIYLGAIANVNYYIVTGALGGDCYGFKIMGGALYGCVQKAGAETAIYFTDLNGITPYNLEARYVPGVNVLFYCNQKLVGSITTGLPTRTSYNTLFDMKVTTITSATRSITCSYFELLQNRRDLKY